MRWSGIELIRAACMSYCRFENTVSDMQDCIDALDNADWDLDEMIRNASSEQEAKAIKEFIELCQDVSRMIVP